MMSALLCDRELLRFRLRLPRIMEAMLEIELLMELPENRRREGKRAVSTLTTILGQANPSAKSTFNST